MKKLKDLNRDQDWTAEGGTANPNRIATSFTDKVMDQLEDTVHELRT